MLYTVRGLQEDSKGVTIRVRIIAKEKERSVTTKDKIKHRVIDLHVGDQTGVVTMSLWDEWLEVGVGDIIDIENGYVNRFMGNLRLNIGIYGRMEKVLDPDFPTIEEILKGEKLRSKRYQFRTK